MIHIDISIYCFYDKKIYLNIGGTDQVLIKYYSFTSILQWSLYNITYSLSHAICDNCTKQQLYMH